MSVAQLEEYLLQELEEFSATEPGPDVGSFVWDEEVHGYSWEWCDTSHD
ncbi:MAG: hypothetical protein SFX18_12270 [Pirellulales bacterium]|nr:hypothetical protein [Pirellulales bacterium]